MDFRTYLDSLAKPDSFRPTGYGKEMYLDAMELSLNGYTRQELEAKCPKNGGLPDDIQAFSRLAALTGFLLANGRVPEYKELWLDMMDICSGSYRLIRDNHRNDFAVKEFMLAYKAAGHLAEEVRRSAWMEQLRLVDPWLNYDCRLRTGTDRRLHNINVYNMAGEWLRQTEGLTDTADYFRAHLPLQLSWFDSNGMYMDPGNPLMYDAMTRLQAAIMLHYGYAGPYAEVLDANLEKGGIISLFMQSAAFEAPFGGRSNQFLFADAVYAALFEYEASRYKRRGDLRTAGIFKRAARLAMASAERWLQAKPPRHMRNSYPPRSGYGTEAYAFYEKYMATLGTNAYLAFLFADDSIEEHPCPAETGGYCMQTSEHFHMIIVNCGGYSVQIDANANDKYDAAGLGRIHRAGFPTELALSTPFTSESGYALPDNVQRAMASISPGWNAGDGTVQFLSSLKQPIGYALEVLEESRERAVFRIIYTSPQLRGCEAVAEQYAVSADGVAIEAELIAPSVPEMYYQLPLFAWNGQEKGEITAASCGAQVAMGEFVYGVETSGELEVESRTIGNRNGLYRLALAASGQPAIGLKLRLKEPGSGGDDCR
ncbi:hypothetical protein [Paenibacillus sp. YN15]|uniref:hypothetical protein n=1 Tax=Paenibacillus sp. YN15 TaxID=1742774 RepID=UPI000DCC9CC4|nr:hypothetical protein [Paenibacillus sp. YN15]RAU93698.1 hypothetical protein DQG13_25250 [Paenibacillus sp. YN15]